MSTAPAIPSSLNTRQKMFCKEYLVDLNATQAYIRAGYSKAGANRAGPTLLSNHVIKEYIDSALSVRAEKVEITTDYVLGNIKGVIDRCVQTLKPVTDRTGAAVLVETAEGEMAPAYTFDAANSLRGLELLGKYKNLFNDTSAQEITVAVQVINQDAAPEQASQVYREMME